MSGGKGRSVASSVDGFSMTGGDPTEDVRIRYPNGFETGAVSPEGVPLIASYYIVDQSRRDDFMAYRTATERATHGIDTPRITGAYLHDGGGWVRVAFAGEWFAWVEKFKVAVDSTEKVDA